MATNLSSVIRTTGILASFASNLIAAVATDRSRKAESRKKVARAGVRRSSLEDRGAYGHLGKRVTS